MNFVSDPQESAERIASDPRQDHRLDIERLAVITQFFFPFLIPDDTECGTAADAAAGRLRAKRAADSISDARTPNLFHAFHLLSNSSDTGIRSGEC